MFINVQRYLLLKLLRTRIYRITYILPAEKVDLDEVKAIIKLIKILNCEKDPNYFTPDKSYKRFLQYYKYRTLMEEKLNGNNFSNSVK